MSDKPEVDHQGDGRKGRVSAAVFGVASILVGVIGAIGGSVVAWTLGTFPRGSSIRPMFQWFTLILIGAGSVFVGLILAIVCLAKAKRRAGLWVLGIAGIILCLAAWQIPHIVWDYIVKKNALILEE